MECDLCSLDSVRNFAKLYNAEEDRLDVLICNAGLAWSSEIVTKDGFNSVIQANYLGHFLLTNLLLDKLKQCRPSRIINVSSGAHKGSCQDHLNMYVIYIYCFLNSALRSIDWNDAFTQFKSFRLLGAYPYSKAFQILSTYKLKRDLLASLLKYSLFLFLF
jgi:NAD(P)-dependent dehydrogenase (short-subunit alcohol dehydrogenase family)